jgi:hypothetical protein
MPERRRVRKRAVACLVFSLPFVSLAMAGMKTDKEQAKLTGPVRTVRIETASWMSDQYGAHTEGAPQLESIFTYDLDGHVTEAVPGHPQEGNPAKVLYHYDTQGLRYEAEDLPVGRGGELCSASGVERDADPVC